MVRPAFSTKVSAPNATPRAQGRWGEESWQPSPLFLPTAHAHPRDTEAHQDHSGSVGLLSTNGWEPSPSTAGDTAHDPLSCPGTPQHGCSLTSRIQVWGQMDTTALLHGSISPLPAALLCRIPSSPYGLAPRMGYTQCGIVTWAGMLNLYQPPCHKKEEAQEMRWRNSPSSYFSRTPTAAWKAVVQRRILPLVSWAVTQACFVISKLKKKKKKLNDEEIPRCFPFFKKKRNWEWKWQIHFLMLLCSGKAFKSSHSRRCSRKKNCYWSFLYNFKTLSG